MDIGHYINIFPINLKDRYANVMITPRDSYTDLRLLRSKISPTRVYGVEDTIYGYGEEYETLDKYGFIKRRINLIEEPKLTRRLIAEAIYDEFSERGYKIDPTKFRYIIIDQRNPISTSVAEVKLLKCFEYRTLFFRSPIYTNLIFGVIIDLKYRTLWNDEPCNPWRIKYNCQKVYGYEKSQQIIRELKVKMSDLTPSFKRNSEAAKIRFKEILEFVNEIGEIRLPTGNLMSIQNGPLRIIIETAGENYDW